MSGSRVSVSCALLLAASLLPGLGTTRADSKAEYVPDSIPGVKTVDAELLARLLTSETPPILIDSRIAKGREKGVIEGSKSLPDIETNCDALARLVPRSDRPVVFYCSSSKCGRSVNAIRVAQACGLTNLMWFRGGFEEWMQAGFPFVPSNRDASN